MSSVFSGTNQGTFISNGQAKILSVRSDIDWMWVFNTTVAAANQTVAVGVRYYWQRGFPAGAMIEFKKSNAANAANLEVYATTGGFTLINTSIDTPGAAVVLTAISNANPPVVSTGNTAGLSNGDVVRLFDVTGAQQLGGEDFTIGNVITNTSFTLAFMQPIVAGTNGTFRRIPYDPYFYPPTREIAKISKATQAIVTFTVTHNYTVGQVLRFKIPTVSSTTYGMTELNDVQATIVAVGAADADGVTNTVTINVDTTSFGTFAWPLTTDPAHTTAQTVPVGQNTAQSILSGVDVLGDSERNIAIIGMTLAAGADSPAGLNGNVIYWVAGKSFSGGA